MGGFCGWRGTLEFSIFKAVGGIYRGTGFKKEHFSDIFYYYKWNYSKR